MDLGERSREAAEERAHEAALQASEQAYLNYMDENSEAAIEKAPGKRRTKPTEQLTKKRSTLSWNRNECLKAGTGSATSVAKKRAQKVPGTSGAALPRSLRHFSRQYRNQKMGLTSPSRTPLSSPTQSIQQNQDKVPGRVAYPAAFLFQ
jgi:hypothetical protein